MCKKASFQTGLLCATALTLLCCSSVSAAEKPQAPSERGSVRYIKPVRSDFDTDINAIYRRGIQKRYAAQDVKMKEAVKLVKDGKFSEGVKAAESVRDELKLESEYVKGDIVAARLAEAEALVAKLRLIWGKEKLKAANKAYIANRFPDAIILAAEAARISPALKEDADAIRKRCQNRERLDKFQTLTSLETANPNLKTLRREASSLLREARVFYENKRYPQALDKVEQVYLRDPFNMEAIALAGDIYRQFFTSGYHRHRADFELQMAYNIWQWVEPVFEAPEVQKEITVEEKSDNLKAMHDKLNSTILTEYVYARGDAKGAVNRLRLYLKQNGLGIDIQDFINADDAANLGTVHLNLRNVSVGDILRYISLMSGLKYRVEPNSVQIGLSVETMYDRSFEVQPHVVHMVYANVSSKEGGSSSSSGGGNTDLSTNGSLFRKRGGQKEKKDASERRIDREAGDDGDEIKLTELEDIKVTSDMFREYLANHGIKFGEGSSVSYIDHNHILRVKNTIENLDQISELLRQQNALQASLVLVEVKCIEISDTDMEELGFDWTLGDNLSSNMTNEGILRDTSKKGWMLGSGIDTRTNAKGERGSMNPIRTGFADGSSSVPLINKLNIFPMLFGSKTPFGSDVPIDISLTINALSQNTRTEVVSAPKVVALSGIGAKANLSKTYYFPEDWSTLDVEIDDGDDEGSNYTIRRPTPEFGDEEKLGIDMQVTPTVTETGTINLKLDFEVSGLNGNDEFTFVLNGVNKGRPISHSFTIWKPVITERKVVTDVDVYDGQTIVLGGSTDNRTMTRIDKIPFLGELPLIGRLFQSQSEKAERRNMILFVTARKLGADGVALSNRNLGLPDFNR